MGAAEFDRRSISRKKNRKKGFSLAPGQAWTTPTKLDL